MTSLFASLSPTSPRIVCDDLLGDFTRADAAEWKKAYTLALGHILHDIRRGDMAAKLLAVRQLGSLLAMARQWELQKDMTIENLAGVVSRAVLVRMVGEAMKDPSDLVRAEMLASLCRIQFSEKLDERLMNTVSEAINDASPVVRMRVAELLGASGLAGQSGILDVFSQDSDDLVRLMAAAFGAMPKKN